MTPLLVEILVQLLLLAGAAALIFIPLWLFRTHRGSAQSGLLARRSTHTVRPGGSRREPEALSRGSVS